MFAAKPLKLANADKPDVVALSTPMTNDELAALYQERKRHLLGKRGRLPKQIVELVLWGPPRHAAENAWPRKKSQKWADDSLAWFTKHFPDSPIVAVHMDEGSPHVHIAAYARYMDANGVMGYGWKRAHSAAADRLTGETPQLNDEKQRIRDQSKAGADMSALLDDYHAAVGAKHGLARGRKGPQRRHKAVEIDEATQRYADDKIAKLKVRETEIEAKRQEFNKSADLVLEAKKVLDAERVQLEDERTQFEEDRKKEAARVEAVRQRELEDAIQRISDADELAKRKWYNKRKQFF